MARRVNASLSEDEIAALEAHPDYQGSLGGLLRVLAMRQLGREADPYADHRARPRDEKGRIMRINKNGDEHLGDLRRAVAKTEYSVRHIQKFTAATSGPAVFKGDQQCGAVIFGHPDNERVALERALAFAAEDQAQS